MDLYPAIDILDGKCVRLYQGEYERETIYSAQAFEVAKSFVEAGASHLHIVDLDAARTGVAVNLSLIADIAKQLPIKVQAGGGVRSHEAARALFEAGVWRVVIGTSAVREPEMVVSLAQEHRVAVGLDSRNNKLATQGWIQSTQSSPKELAKHFEGSGVDAFIVTDIDKDGTLAGPNSSVIEEILEVSEIDVIASGGVANASDIRMLCDLAVAGRKVKGVIVGKALYEGRVTVGEALNAVGGKT